MQGITALAVSFFNAMPRARTTVDAVRGDQLIENFRVTVLAFALKNNRFVAFHLKFIQNRENPLRELSFAAGGIYVFNADEPEAVMSFGVDETSQGGHEAACM